MNEVEKKSEIINPHHKHPNMMSPHVETKKLSQQQHQAHHDPTTHHIMMIADFKRRFIVSFIFTIPILLLSPIIQEWLGFNLSFDGSTYLVFLLTSFVFFYGSWPFLKGIFEELKSKSLGMMTLIAVAISVAYFYSTAVVFGLKGEVFFWELATLIDIILLGHWIEMKSVLDASNALEKHASLMPDTSHTIKENDIIDVKISDLSKSDRVLIKPLLRIKMKNNEKYKGKRRMNYLPLLFLYPFTTLNIDYGWMIGGDHMMDWWEIPFMGFWMIGIWFVFIVIAFLVFQDANKRGMNGLLWLIMVILPIFGFVFLVVYLVIREDKALQQSTTKMPAEQILDERYAKGEITREEYQQKKNDMEQGR